MIRCSAARNSSIVTSSPPSAPRGDCAICACKCQCLVQAALHVGGVSRSVPRAHCIFWRDLKANGRAGGSWVTEHGKRAEGVPCALAEGFPRSAVSAFNSPSPVQHVHTRSVHPKAAFQLLRRLHARRGATASYFRRWAALKVGLRPADCLRGVLVKGRRAGRLPCALLALRVLPCL